MYNTNKEKTLDERLDYLTKQFELLLAKEIERNKELQVEREQRNKEREDDRKQRKIEREDEFERQKQRDAARDARDATRDAARDAREAERYAERYAREEADRKQRRMKYEVVREAERKELRLSFKKLNKIIGDYGLSSGREAEFNFQLALKRNHLLCGGIQFDSLEYNVQKTKKSRDRPKIEMIYPYEAMIYKSFVLVYLF